VPFTDDFLDPDKNNYFNDSRMYHKKSSNLSFNYRFENKSMYNNLLSVLVLNNS